MLILPDTPGYQHLSETRIAVCLFPGPVFVRWFKAFSAEGTEPRDSRADHSRSAGSSFPGRGVVTSTTLEDDESPEAFHACTRYW